MAENSVFKNLVETASLETTPTGAKKVGDFRDHIAEGTRIYITFLPGSDFKRHSRHRHRAKKAKYDCDSPYCRPLLALEGRA